MSPVARVVLVVAAAVGAVNATCYFPQEFLGEYTMQSTVNAGPTVQYSTLNVTQNSIPIWGNCHKRIDNNFILMINYGENSCIRCLRLKLRSKNVLQVLASSQETISKCFINEESAEESCPKESAVKDKTAAEIILFKKRDIDGDYTAKEYCPFERKFSVSYQIDDESKTKSCMLTGSSLDTCPSGSTLNLRFPRCNLNYELDCLGHWEGPGDQKYLALLDRRLSRTNKPQYRCALYEQDENTGVVNLALSKDSTCVSELFNATHGYETMVLTPLPESAWPMEVLYSSCQFPDWMQGEWEHITVRGDTVIYKNHATFKTSTIKCVGSYETEDKFLIFSRTQCNEELFNCIQIAKRGNNILEFQFGMNGSSISSVDDLCTERNFVKVAWTTQGRIGDHQDSATTGICPITGEYTGFIPNSPDLCAKLWSDCRAPELMYYQVSDCATGDIYEERQYKCLGHWSEDDLLYTYTQRYDVAGTYECFVGSKISETEIYIKEAGEHCQRHMDPIKNGMKLSKQGKGLYSCIGDPSVGYHPSEELTTQSTTTKRPWPYDIEIDPSITKDIVDNKINSASVTSLAQFCLVVLVVITMM